MGGTSAAGRPAGISHVASKTLCAHADLTTPAGEDGFFGRLLPRPPTAFPLWQEGRLQRTNFRGLLKVHAFRPAHLHLGCTKEFPRGFSRTITRLDCSSGYRANRQFPGRDFHPLAPETQKVFP